MAAKKGDKVYQQIALLLLLYFAQNFLLLLTYMQPDLNYAELYNKVIIVTASITVMHKKIFQQ